MVIGGSADRNTRDWVDDIEIASTDPNTTPVPHCLRNLKPFPRGTIYYGAGALTLPGTGSQDENSAPSLMTLRCRLHDREGSSGMRRMPRTLRQQLLPPLGQLLPLRARNGLLEESGDHVGLEVWRRLRLFRPPRRAYHGAPRRSLRGRSQPTSSEPLPPNQI